jgi:CheY-like chemotaxis protein
MRRVLVVSEESGVAKRLASTDPEAIFEVTQATWSSWDIATLTTHVADVFLFDYRNPRSVPGEIAARLATELRRHDPQVPLVFVADFDPYLREMIQAAVGERKVTFAGATAFANVKDLQSLLTHLVTLHDAGNEQVAFQPRAGSSARAFPHLTPEVRNPKSGRLDARRISGLFAVPLNRLAKSLDVDAAAVYKTPDAPALQARLLLYERIAKSLLRLLGSEEGLRIWLNTPEPDLDNEVPRDLILNGEGEAVAELLEDMQEGQPG